MFPLRSGRQNQITRDDDTQRIARPDGECRLDVQLSPDDLLSGLIDRVRRSLADGARQIVIPA